MTKDLLKSAIVHFILLSVFFLSSYSPKTIGDLSEKQKGKQEETTKKEIPHEMEIEIVENMPAPEAEHKCEKWYGGIGIQYDNGPYARVTFVPEGYPASKAGIMVGDTILSAADVRGPVGTQVTIKIQRGSELLTFTMIRARICTEEVAK